MFQLTVRHMIEKCGCVTFRYPRKSYMPVCNMTQMQCILKLKETSGFMEHECLPDCEGSFIYAYQWKSSKQDTKVGGLRIKMLSIPFVRYRRYVLHTTLDLIGI